MAPVVLPRAAFLAAFLLTSIVGAGCGRSGPARVPVYPVHGSVSVVVVEKKKKKTPPKTVVPVRAQVVFHPKGEADPNVPLPTGQVEEDGTFKLSTYTAGDGAPAGEYAVTVRWYAGESTIGGDAESTEDRLENEYGEPDNTPLHARVEKAETRLEPFVLKMNQKK